MFYQTRKFAKDNGYAYCSTSHGKIFLKKIEGYPQIGINNEADLKKLSEKLLRYKVTLMLRLEVLQNNSHLVYYKLIFYHKITLIIFNCKFTIAHNHTIHLPKYIQTNIDIYFILKKCYFINYLPNFLCCKKVTHKEPTEEPLYDILYF